MYSAFNEDLSSRPDDVSSHLLILSEPNRSSNPFSAGQVNP